MEKSYNKGFSLVELIIVIAIMAVLVGVMAPQYLKYLEKTEKTTDCSSIGTVLDSCEVMAIDPNTTWKSGTANQITIVISSTGTTYSGGASAELEKFVSSSNVILKSKDWGPFTIYATRTDNGRVNFDISDDSQITTIEKYSTALSKRLE